jgi:hypothetical protein
VVSAGHGMRITSSMGQRERVPSKACSEHGMARAAAVQPRHVCSRCAAAGCAVHLATVLCTQCCAHAVRADLARVREVEHRQQRRRYPAWHRGAGAGGEGEAACCHCCVLWCRCCQGWHAVMASQILLHSAVWQRLRAASMPGVLRGAATPTEITEMQCFSRHAT